MQSVYTLNVQLLHNQLTECVIFNRIEINKNRKLSHELIRYSMREKMKKHPTVDGKLSTQLRSHVQIDPKQKAFRCRNEHEWMPLILVCAFYVMRCAYYVVGNLFLFLSFYSFYCMYDKPFVCMRLLFISHWQKKVRAILQINKNNNGK